jgi:hypothetical protein
MPDDRRFYIACAVAAVAIAAIPLSFAGPGGLRLAVIGPFLLAGPGTALALLLRLDSADTGPVRGAVPLVIAIAIAFSLALSTLVATGMLYAQQWNPQAGVMLLSVITLGLLALAAKRSRESTAGA